ncbi:MAG: hypothetical protein E7045_10230 [Lentisphaerae bacterium]|nr:hypothetical protein [Lentisphaerota bacterium]
MPHASVRGAAWRLGMLPAVVCGAAGRLGMPHAVVCLPFVRRGKPGARIYLRCLLKKIGKISAKGLDYIIK